MYSIQNFKEELSSIDYSSIEKESIDTSFAFKSGLVYIDSLIKQRLSNYSDRYFFEYSLLSSTINPSSSSLYSFAAVSSDDDVFVERIGKYVNSIIQYLFPSEKVDTDKIELLSLNWFHNPELFLFPTISRIEPFICKKVYSNNINDLTPDNTGYYHKITLDDGRVLYVQNMSYPRGLGEMLEASGRMASKEPNPSSLIELYHSGVQRSKQFYDRYLRDNEDDVYWFVTFPLLSAKNAYLSEYYKKFFPKDYIEVSEHTPGIGHFFIYFRLKKNINQKSLEESIFNLFIELNHSIGFFSNNYTYATGLALLEKSKQESVKSAKSAIMSRNMSHNLGSHVMAYLKQHLSSVTNMLNDNVLTRLCGEKVDYEKLLDYLEKNVPGFSNINSSSSSLALSPQDKVGSRLALPFLVGLGHFVSYLQERQDFIATIATDYIPYYATVNFKDSIYDELNPDKRYERHQDRKNQQLDNILLGNIARSEGLGRQTSPTKDSGGKLCDIVLKYKNFDGSICEEGSDAYKSLEELRHLNVSLPGGIVGRQAVFSIVENVIRNAAKHGSWRDVGKLELTFNKYDLLVDEIPDDDNLEGHKSLKEVIDAYYSPAEDINDLYIITLTDNTKCSEESLWKLRLALDDDYIDSAGLMKGANKGLKEMRISAAWLRALKDETACVNPQIQDHNDVGYIRQKGLKAPILYARIATDENWGEHLQYIFCLPKPKVLAVVSDYLTEICRDIHIEGCRFYTEDEFAEENNKSYEFILCGDNRYDRIRPYASSRTFTFSESGIARKDLSALKNQDDLSSLLERLYKEMFDYTEGDKINIDDKKTYGKWKNNIENSKETTLPIEEFSVEETTKESLDEVSTEDNSIQKGLVSGKYLKRGNVLVSDGKICGQYIYRTHHDSIEQFMKFMEAKVDADFVEGITGNNSTDRLVRNEDIDGPWFYRHLHAMKMNVAVCDERLFSKITGLEETDFTRGKIVLATIDNLDDVKEYYSTMSPEEAAIINSFDNPEELNEYVDENFRKDLQVAEKYSKGITAVSYMQKKVYVYTFIQDAEISAKYYLIGAAIQNHKPKYKDANKNNYECQCSRLAELTWSKENGLSVKPFTDGGYIAGYFDYLTVHQGLLDKLYEAFGVKEVPEYKDLLTRQLYEFFCKKSVRKIIPVQVKTPEKVEHRTFLSGMMVHSGRSKPSAQDMPQVLPFIQYAALEHAVMDCKYSLVELLDHARYEQ